MAKSELPKLLRCAIYTRKSSTAGLEKDFNSLDAQREACEAYIQTRVHEGWVRVEESFSDGGYTGANTERPGFQKLMAWIGKGRLDVVVVYKVDRLSRSLIDFSQVMEHFNQHGIAFVSVTQHFSTTDAVGRLTLNMLMSFAEFEREMITERIRDKVRAARRKGRWTGGCAPLGYRSEKARLLIHEEEAPWVKQVFSWYLEGVSALVIGQRLNEASVPLKTAQRLRSNPWTKDLILRILRNHLYLGEISCQGEFVLAEHSSLIERDTFDRVQILLAPKLRRDRQVCRNPIYLIRGTLRCGLCGSAMTSASTFREGRLHRYYRCSTRDKKGKKICPTKQLPAEAIEAYVVERVQVALNDPNLQSVLEVHLGRLGLQAPKEGFSHLWEALTLPNRRRLIGLLVEEAKIDEFKGSLSIRLRDLNTLPFEESLPC